MEQNEPVVAAVTRFEEEHGDHNVRVVTSPGGIDFVCHDCDASVKLAFSLQGLGDVPP